MFKKGQAALEFLMTYGWAILVVLVAIGALAYFGVLNPGAYLPNTCLVGPGFSCEDFQIRGDGTGTIILKNGGKETISSPAMYLDATAGSCNGTSIQVGGQTTCGFTGLTATAGEKYSATLKFGYTSGAGIAHNVTGKLTVKAE